MLITIRKTEIKMGNLSLLYNNKFYLFLKYLKDSILQNVFKIFTLIINY